MALFEQKFRRELTRIENKLDLVLRHLDIDPEVAFRDEVTALAQAGERVAAIRAYKRATGVGLREARDYVDRLASGPDR